MAVREVNLIPSERLVRRRMTRRIVLWTSLLFVSFSLTAGLLVWALRKDVWGKGPDLTSQTVRVHLATTMEKVSRAEEELNKLLVMRDIVAYRSCFTVMGELASAMNEGTWLTEFSLNSAAGPASGSTLALTGLAQTAADLGTFLTQLSETDTFRDVVLLYSRRGKSEGQTPDGEDALPLVEFRISSLVPPP